MTRPGSWLTPSSEAPATGNPLLLSRSASLVRLGLFFLSLLALAFAFSALALPWVNLPWWRVVRRSASVAAAVSVWLLARWERRTVPSYGLLGWKEAGKGQLLTGLGLGLVVLGGFFGLSLAMGWCEVAVTTDRFRLWRTVLGFLPAAFLVAGLEELVFRGVILQHLLPVSRRAAVLGSSLLYALVHLKALRADLPTAMELVGLFLLGCLLAQSTLVTGRLFLAIGLHAALAYGARINKLLVLFSDPGMVWLTGTSRLVNGVLGWAALGLLWAGIAWWHRKRRN